MALNQKGIGTAVMQDSVQFFLGAVSPTATGVFNDYFLKTNKVANLQSIGDLARAKEQIDATCLDSDNKLNVPGFQEATTVDTTIVVVAGQTTDINTWYETGKQLVWGYVAFDRQDQILYAYGGTATIGTATLTGASVGNLITMNVQLNIETMKNYDSEEITPGGVDPASAGG